VGPLPDHDDLLDAESLTRLVHSELEKYGTSADHQLTDEQIELAQRALVRVLARLGIPLNLPWRHFTAFRSHWMQQGCQGSWQARRDLLAAHFDPVFDALDSLEESRLDSVAADGVSPHGKTGWPAVDTELLAVKRRFQTATSAQDYRDVGNGCVAVLEALSRTVYDPSRHLRSGEEPPLPAKTKQRLERYVEDSLAGGDNVHLRGLATKVIDVAQAVKHSTTPTRREAGIAADAVVLLANILRRAEQDQ
jgi:hypothetical protein